MFHVFYGCAPTLHRRINQSTGERTFHHGNMSSISCHRTNQKPLLQRHVLLHTYTHRQLLLCGQWVWSLQLVDTITTNQCSRACGHAQWVCLITGRAISKHQRRDNYKTQTFSDHLMQLQSHYFPAVAGWPVVLGRGRTTKLHTFTPPTFQRLWQVWTQTQMRQNAFCFVEQVFYFNHYADNACTVCVLQLSCRVHV